jgi:predicted transposase YdaD
MTERRKEGGREGGREAGRKEGSAKNEPMFQDNATKRMELLLTKMEKTMSEEVL